MQVKKQILVVSNNSNNLTLLLAILSDLEYKPDMQIDLILEEQYTDLEIKKFINCISYLLQINYSNHGFRIFTSDKNLIRQFKLNENIKSSKRYIKVSTKLGLINENIVDNNNDLINLYKYNAVLNIKADRIETFYKYDTLKLKV